MLKLLSSRTRGYRYSRIYLSVTINHLTQLPDNDPYWDVLDRLETVYQFHISRSSDEKTELLRSFRDSEDLMLYADTVRKMIKDPLISEYVCMDQVHTYCSGLTQKELTDPMHTVSF